jgi:hypothetical protein
MAMAGEDLGASCTFIATYLAGQPARPTSYLGVGGLVLAASQIADALRAHPGRVTVFVPHYAMSGGTLLALSADEIVMAPHAVLGPVDPQLGQHPAASLIKVVEQKPIAEIDDQTLIEADQAGKALSQVEASRRPSVEYIPTPYRARDREPKPAPSTRGVLDVRTGGARGGHVPRATGCHRAACPECPAAWLSRRTATATTRPGGRCRPTTQRHNR